MRSLFLGTTAATVAVLLLVSAPLATHAQERPDLSGSWTLADGPGEPGRTGPPQGARMGGGQGGMMMMGPGGLGQQVTLHQDANTLTLVRTTPGGEIRSVYNLDGSESPNRMGMMGGAQREIVSRASWDGPVLVIVTPIFMGDRSGESRTALSLDDSGRLVVEATRTGVGGETARSRAVYTRN